MRETNDKSDGEIVEQLDGLEGDDGGGVPYDDDFDDEAPEQPGDRGPVAGAPAYDSAKILEGRGIGYPTATPLGMQALKGYVISRFAGTDLGCLSRPPRSVRGGGSPSLHNWGIAWDWRFAGPGPGRATADAVIAFCLEHALALGVQAIHDYEQCRYWKSYADWKTATKSASTGFGQPWAQWLHIERTWAAANDGRAIGQALEEAGVGGGAAAPTSAPTSAPTTTAGASGVVLPDPVLKQGDQGANVARLQDFVRFFAFADFSRSDGQFGPRTAQAVMKAQQAFKDRGLYGAKIDGEYGPKSAAAAAQFIAG